MAPPKVLTAFVEEVGVFGHVCLLAGDLHNKRWTAFRSGPMKRNRLRETLLKHQRSRIFNGGGVGVDPGGR